MLCMLDNFYAFVVVCLLTFPRSTFKKIIIWNLQVLIAVILKAKYQIVLSKAVVEVDRPMKVLSMHIQKPY